MSNSLVTPWTVAYQAPLSKRFPRQEYWNGLPFPSPGDLPNPRIEPMSSALAGGLFTTEPPEKPLTCTRYLLNVGWLVTKSFKNWKQRELALLTSHLIIYKFYKFITWWQKFFLTQKLGYFIPLFICKNVISLF